jgi:hypothetical protein
MGEVKKGMNGARTCRVHF